MDKLLDDVRLFLGKRKNRTPLVASNFNDCLDDRRCPVFQISQCVLNLNTVVGIAKVTGLKQINRSVEMLLPECLLRSGRVDFRFPPLMQLQLAILIHKVFEQTPGNVMVVLWLTGSHG